MTLFYLILFKKKKRKFFLKLTIDINCLIALKKQVVKFLFSALLANVCGTLVMLSENLPNTVTSFLVKLK